MTHSIQDLIMLSEKLYPTGLLPDHVKNPGQALAVMLAGQELGMAPMESFRSLTLVKGKVVEQADSQLGRFKSMGGKATFTTLDANKAVLELVHPNGDKHTETFSMEDAKRARLLGDNWQKYPKAMLRSRVITAGLKSLGWTGAIGAYDPEEAEEIGAPRHVSTLAEPVRESIATQKALEPPVTPGNRMTMTEAMADDPFHRSKEIMRDTVENVIARPLGTDPVPMSADEWILDPEPILAHEATGPIHDPRTGSNDMFTSAPPDNAFEREKLRLELDDIEPPPGPFISDGQRRALWAHARKFNTTEEELRLKLSTLGITSTAQIPQALFLGILDWVAEGEGVPE